MKGDVMRDATRVYASAPVCRKETLICANYWGKTSETLS